jgi:hypothetical protein
MDMELSTGYFPKYDQTKTFDIVSKETEKYKVGEITFAAFSKEVSLNHNAVKMWRFVGILDEVTSECWLNYDSRYDYSRYRRIKEELFGVAPEKTVINRNVSFEGMLYQGEEDPKYSFDIKEVKINGKVLKTKTGKKRWKEDYSVPYLSGKSVDEMIPMFIHGNQRTQKEVGKLILDKFEVLVARYNTHEWNEENNELAKKELKRREMNEKPKTKRNIPLLAGISAGVASIWYFFTK